MSCAVELPSRAAWEARLRRLLQLPRHNTANDGAAVLAHIAGAGALFGLLGWLVSSPALAWAALTSGSGVCGLALQQYTWYTACSPVECWADEAAPVLSIIVLTGLLLMGIGMVFALLLGVLGLRALVLGGLATILLVGPWLGNRIIGSLYDGLDKAKGVRTY